MVLAKILAHVVFPTPLGPQNRYAWARCLFLIALFSVFVIVSWPTTISKVAGRYFRAETMKFSIILTLGIQNCASTNIVKKPSGKMSVEN